MDESPSIGPILIVLGVLLVGVGVVASTGALSWFGRLPGDIRIEKPGVRVYAPLTSMIVVSLILSVLSALFRWFRPGS